MELNDFVANFADIFDDIDIRKVTAETKFKELDGWGSLTVLGVIAMAKTKYNKTITGIEINKCNTILDIFNLLTSK